MGSLKVTDIDSSPWSSESSTAKARATAMAHKVRHYLERRDAGENGRVLCVYREVKLLKRRTQSADTVAIVSYDEKPGVQAIGVTAPTEPDGRHRAFAATKEEREARGDPRPSVAERYPIRAVYLEPVRQAAQQLIEEGYLLAEDLEPLVDKAAETLRYLRAIR